MPVPRPAQRVSCFDPGRSIPRPFALLPNNRPPAGGIERCPMPPGDEAGGMEHRFQRQFDDLAERSAPWLYGTWGGYTGSRRLSAMRSAPSMIAVVPNKTAD